MGRKVRCHVTVDDPEALFAAATSWFTDNGYEVERAVDDTIVILDTGSAAWTIVGTHQWSKTSRTVIATVGEDLPDNTVEFLYDVSWFSIHYRPQGKVLEEVEELLEATGFAGAEITHEYESQI